MKTYQFLPDESVGTLKLISHERAGAQDSAISKSLFQPLMKFKKMVIIFAGTAVGALTGFLYWKCVGFDEQTPVISSVWVSVSFASGLSGLLVAIVSSPRQIEA